MSANDDTHDSISPPEALAIPQTAAKRGSDASTEKEAVMSTSPTVADLPGLKADQKSISGASQATRTGEQTADKSGDLEKAPESAEPAPVNVLANMSAARKNVLLFCFVSHLYFGGGNCGSAVPSRPPNSQIPWKPR